MKQAIRDVDMIADIYYPCLRRTKILFTQLPLKIEHLQLTRGQELTTSSSDTQRSVKTEEKLHPYVTQIY